MSLHYCQRQMPSLLSLSPFSIIVAAVATVAVVVIIVDVVLVAPATIALAAFVVTLAVVTTMFLAVDVGLMFDCYVCRRLASPLLPLLPSPSSGRPPLLWLIVMLLSLSPPTHFRFRIAPPTAGA